MVPNKKPSNKTKSVISDIRKGQIAEAAITVINESGYSNASLANIAKQAGISTALISYSFPAKKDLTDFLFEELLKRKITYIIEWVKEAESPTEKLFAYIRADLSYSSDHPPEGVSMAELMSNARNKDGTPYYQSESDDSNLLEEIIKIIQEDGGFPNINDEALSMIIKGAIKEHVNQQNSNEIDQKTYGDELISVVSRLTGFSKKYTVEPLRK